MTDQIVTGALLITMSLLINASGVAFAIDTIQHLFHGLESRPPPLRRLGAIFAAIMLVLLLNTISVFIWAGAFVGLNIVEGWEPAVYFTLVCYTTLGFGDILGAPEWRLLTGFAATNGLIAFGVSTAFLIELMRRIHLVDR